MGVIRPFQLQIRRRRHDAAQKTYFYDLSSHIPSFKVGGNLVPICENQGCFHWHEAPRDRNLWSSWEKEFAAKFVEYDFFKVTLGLVEIFQTEMELG